MVIVSTYVVYIPPNFQQGFLSSRGDYFFRTPYCVGFYAHILASPLALICGTLQFSKTILRRWPKVHRILGRAYVIGVLAFAAPGGFVISFGTVGGLPSFICFLTMSCLAWGFTWQAWRTARRRAFSAHGRWMWRSYLMMVSAIILRIIDPALREAGVPDLLSYQLCVWLSWVPSLLIFEALQWRRIPAG